METGLTERGPLTKIVRAAFGSRRRLDDVVRLRGGTGKEVYRVTLDDGSSAVLYVWDTAGGTWPAPGPAEIGDGADPFSAEAGVDCFETSHTRLSALGVRTPRVYLVDRGRTHYPADVALVEDVRGATLETLLRVDPYGSQPLLASLDDALEAMHRHRGRHFGRLAVVDRGDAPQDRPCELVVLDRALGHLGEAAGRVGQIAAARGRLEDAVRALAAAVRPRLEYGLIHGQLGPERILVDDGGRPVITDIEGAMYFDVEWEHAFLQIRFGPHYPRLRRHDLDTHRLRFYRLALHLSLIAGPLRLLDGEADHPTREMTSRVVEFNTERALAFVR